MTVTYTYNGGGPGTLVVTGTGPEHTVLLDPPAEGTGFYVVDASFPPGTPAVPALQFSTYSNGSQPGLANPLPLTYTYNDPLTGQRLYGEVSITHPNEPLTLIPPGLGISLTTASGTYSNGDSWRVQESYTGGGYHNLLDLIKGWEDALDKDNKVQAYFEAVPGVGNQANSRGDFLVSGEWEELKKRGYEFYIGNPAQTGQKDLGLLTTRDYQFTVDAAYPGGVPSPVNPMVINYSYENPAGTLHNASLTVTGTGPDFAVMLEPAGENSNFYLPRAEYAAGDTFNFSLNYDSTLPPSPANLMPVTYAYKDDLGVRRIETTYVSDLSAGVTLNPVNPDSPSVLNFSAGSRFQYGDSFDLSLQQYQQGQTYSQKLLEEITALQSNLLKYTGDAGAKLNNLEVRLQFMGDDVIRIDQRLTQLEDVDLDEIASRYAMLQVMYQAALQTVNAMFSVGLANYI
jgi:hypothetical protein